MIALMRELEEFRESRGWTRYHTPQNLAEAINVESGELLECFLWGGSFADSLNHEENVKRELADVLIYCLNMCLTLGLDPVQIVREKMVQNARKYPL